MFFQSNRFSKKLSQRSLLIGLAIGLLVSSGNKAFSKNGFLDYGASDVSQKSDSQSLQSSKSQRGSNSSGNNSTSQSSQVSGPQNSASQAGQNGSSNSFPSKSSQSSSTWSFANINSWFNPGSAQIGQGASMAGQAAQIGTTWTGSFVDNLNRWYNQDAPHLGLEARSESTTTQSGSDQGETYGPTMQPGMTDSGMSPSVQGQKPETVAQQTNASQTPPQLPHHNLMTEYKGPGGVGVVGEWGPPSRLPYISVQLLDNTHLSAPANPAMPIGLPGWITNGASNTSNTVNLAIQGNAAYQGAQEQNNPSMHTSQAQLQAKMQQTANSTGDSAQAQFGSNTQTVQSMLINVANEGAATATSANAQQKTLSQAVWMVQQMWKSVFVPMAILFLLPGAVLTQAKAIANTGNPIMDLAIGGMANPLDGILRSLVALFLIPATQLIVSYSIDVGNSLTNEVTQFIQADQINGWAGSLFHPNGQQTPKQFQDSQNQESGAQATFRAGFGAISGLLNYALMVLCAYQVVMVSYLFLLGPICAAFLAWPSGVGTLFRTVFSSWLEGLFNLVLWRFWWCVILLCMSTRIHWLMEMGQYDPKSPWEPIVFLAFTVMLTYVPFMALDFRPGDMVDSLLKATSSNGGSGSASRTA